MADSGSVLSAFADLIFGWVPKLSAVRRRDGAVSQPASEVQTKALARFLKCLSTRDAPVLLDLGPVVGQNVAFFGEQLGCKIFVEDIGADLERFAARDNWDEFPAFLSKRFDRPTASIDGILCWDLFDHLDKGAAKALASELARLLKPDGVLLAYFATTREPSRGYAKFVVVDESTLDYRPYASSTGAERHVLQSRDLDRLFDGLKVSDSFLLLNRSRELLFRKRGPVDRGVPARPAAVPPARPAVVRPVPAAASLSVAAGRASAGLRRTPPRPTPWVGENGHAPARPAEPPPATRARAVEPERADREELDIAAVPKKPKAPRKPRAAKATGKPRRRQPPRSVSASEG